MTTTSALRRRPPHAENGQTSEIIRKKHAGDVRATHAAHRSLAPRRASAGRVTLEDIIAIARLPSSKRIEGWRTPLFDKVKAFATKVMETNPSAPMKPMLDPKADIGPDLDKIPALPAALERIGLRYRKGGMKSDIHRVTHLPTEIQDYVIIGSGMAGVAAAAVFADANHAGAKLKGLVLEGGAQIGGRARDVDVNGKKAGLGPSWLHGKHNVLRRMADLLGLTRERTFLDREVYIDGRKATQKEAEGLFREEDRAEAAMEKALRNGKESKNDAASRFYPHSIWKTVALDEAGKGDQGRNAGKDDAIDTSEFQSNQDDFIKEGMQEFVTRIAKAAELDVAFNAVVKSARRGDDDIWTVKLTDGRTLRTKQVIYTGSTAALSHIDFGELPRAKLEALHALPMGNFTKFLFTTKDPLDRPDTFRNSWVVDVVTDKRTKERHEDVQWVVKYGDDPRANIMFADEALARGLLAMPESKQRAYVATAFAKIAGSRGPVQITSMAHTPFAAEPLIGGSYTSLLPGMEGAHTIYAAPYHGLNFAGEAAGTAQNNASLLAAFTSGIDSAYDVIAAVLPSRG